MYKKNVMFVESCSEFLGSLMLLLDVSSSVPTCNNMFNMWLVLLCI